MTKSSKKKFSGKRPGSKGYKDYQDKITELSIKVRGESLEGETVLI